jgi:hypothetical protein
MTLVRGMFLAAFLMLTAGSVGIHSAVAPLFSGLGGKPGPTRKPAAPAPTVTPAATRAIVRPPATRESSGPASPVPSSTPAATATVTATPAPGVTFLPTVSPTPANRPTLKRHLIRRHHTTARRHSLTPTPTPAPTATRAAGTLTLVRYWISSVRTRRGGTNSVSYVIDNATGRTARVMLGATIKATRDLSWISAGISDPADDLIAVVAPGVSAHLRYFTVAAPARPGTYDVAWGLRNAVSGRRVALVFAPAALQITR